MLNHPITKSILSYYKYYPVIYVGVCAYHAYGYYEHAKAISEYIGLIKKRKNKSDPREQDYEWVTIEEEILDDDDVYFDLNMIIMTTEPEDIEAGGERTNEIDFIDIPL